MSAEPERRTVACAACLARLVAENWLRTQELPFMGKASR